MRFMMIAMPKAYESIPSLEGSAKMRVYNKSLQQAGVLLAVDGLAPPSTGARVSFSDGKATVTDGPFAESKEVIGGYWIIEVRSREEAVEWAKRAPVANNVIIEVRRFLELSDFPEDEQKAIQGFERPATSAARKA